ncbi:MAG: cellulase family glycosylhydrolase [Anaerolineae bacterium]
MAVSHRKLSHASRSLLLVLAILGVIGIGIWLSQASWRPLLASWTGEEDLKEQIKGTLALAYLRLSQPSPETAPLTPMPYTGLCPYGANTFLEQEVEIAKIERSLQMLSQSGFCWIRQMFPWEDIEISAKGDYWDHKWDVDAWAKYDRIVNLAAQYDIQIIARLDRPPAWSRKMGSATGWTMAPPDNYEDFGDFVYAVVSRYRGRIRYYQIWNEPNIYPEWGDQPTDPAAYVKLLQIAYKRAKEADPNCVIIAAALAQTIEETPLEFGPRNMSDLLYLEKMYQAGLAGNYDIMGAMVYGLWTGPNDLRTSRDRANFSRVQLLRQIMVEHGDAAKPIWASEVGWNTQPITMTEAVPYGRVSNEQQAQYTVEAYQRAARDWPWMGVMSYWFLRRPSDAEATQPWYYFRMLEPDFSPLPVYAALSTLATQPKVVMPGYFQEDHWALLYQGDWQLIQDDRAVLGAYRLGDQGSEIGFMFEGTDLDIVVYKPGLDTELAVIIDGQAPKTIRITGNAALESVNARIAHALPVGRHDVKIKVVTGSLNFDGLIAQQTPRRVGLKFSIAALLLLVCLLVVVRIRRGLRGNKG